MKAKAIEQIEEMLANSEGYDEEKSDFLLPISETVFDEQGRITTNGEGMSVIFGKYPPAIPSQWAFGQICDKLGKSAFGKGSNKRLPEDYLLALEPDIRADLLNRHIHNYPMPGKKFFIRNYGDTCRAVLSDEYAPVDNTSLLDLVHQIVLKEGTPDLKLIRPSVTPNSLNLKMIWQDTNAPDNGGGNYGIGLYVSNGEIGDRKVRVFPMIQRTSCTNSIILKEGAGLELFHKGSPAVLRTRLKGEFLGIFPQAADLLNKMILAHEEELPNFSEVLSGLAKKNGWDDKTKLSVAAGTEMQSTRAALVNGITYAAHEIHKDDPDAMAEMEIFGGSILVANDSVFAEAVRIGRKVEKKARQ